MKPKQLFQVLYQWRDDRRNWQRGRTVVTAESQQDAEAKFQRMNRHVEVVPNPSAPAIRPAKEPTP